MFCFKTSNQKYMLSSKKIKNLEIYNDEKYFQQRLKIFE